MKTAYLDPETWDLVLDINGDIALADEPYSTLQDCCSRLRTRQGECYYDTTLGVPYFQDILNRNVNLELIRSEYIRVALQDPRIVSAKVFFRELKDRRLLGQVQITDINGIFMTAEF